VTRGPRCTPQNTDVAQIGSNRDDDSPSPEDSAHAARAPLDQRDSSVASRRWWDSDAAAYVAEHGDFLGDRGGVPSFVWGPEGLTEQEAGLLGPLTGRQVLEVGAGAAQGSRWLREQGAHPVALDLSMGMLLEGARLGQQVGQSVPLVQADAVALPFGPGSFDLACSAYGAVPFVADVGLLFREVARVLRPGGLWVFAVTHPIRWAFPDDASAAGLVADRPYFDRTPYVERDENGLPSYVEHHRTLGDLVRLVTAAGLHLVNLVEPEWPEGHHLVWGGWSATRGKIIPGTAILVCSR
jgi:SAM-dependent methyltransferase